MALPVTLGVFTAKAYGLTSGTLEGATVGPIETPSGETVRLLATVPNLPRILSITEVAVLKDGVVVSTRPSTLCPFNVCGTGVESIDVVNTSGGAFALRYRTHSYTNNVENVVYYQTNTITLTTSAAAPVVTLAVAAVGPTILLPGANISLSSTLTFPGTGYALVSQRWLKDDYVFEAGDTLGGSGHDPYSGTGIVVDGVGFWHSGVYKAIATYSYGGASFEVVSNSLTVLVQVSSGDVDFSYGVGGFGVKQYSAFSLSPATDIVGAVWTATGLPPGVVLSPVNGTLSGAATLPGVFVAAIKAANASVSHRELLPIGVEPTDFVAISGLEVAVELTKRLAKSAKASSGVLFSIKENDDVVFHVQFRKNNIPIGIPLQQLRVTVKEGELGEVLVESGDFHAINQAQGLFAIRVPFVSAALTEALSVHEDDTENGGNGVQMEVLCEISWLEDTQWEVGPSQLVGSARPFRVLVARDFGQAS
jgi:hypothetical protein